MHINATNSGTLGIVTHNGTIFGIFAEASDAAHLARAMEDRAGHPDGIACRWMSFDDVLLRLTDDLGKYYGMEQETIKSWIQRGMNDLSRVLIADKQLRLRALVDYRGQRP